VPNPCTGGFELLNGSTAVAIVTSESSTGFTLSAALSSSGSGSDALPDGSVILNGTQKPNYLYGSDVSADAGFPAKPANFAATVALTDFLVRDSTTDTGDSFLLDTVLQLNFTNGVPSVPTIQALNVRCE
jgi:hypothetical protein